MAPKKKDAKKKKDDDADGDIKLPQPLKPAAGAFQHNEFIIEPDAMSVKHTRSWGLDAAIGADVIEHGVVRFNVTLRSHGSNPLGAAYGSGLCVGVLNAAIEPTDMGGGPAWGICFPRRRFVATHNCYERGELRHELCPGSSDGFVDGMVLHFELDMGGADNMMAFVGGAGGALSQRMVQRTMWVAVNDGPFVECCRNLPPAVRPRTQPVVAHAVATHAWRAPVCARARLPAPYAAPPWTSRCCAFAPPNPLPAGQGVGAACERGRRGYAQGHADLGASHEESAHQAGEHATSANSSRVTHTTCFDTES